MKKADCTTCGVASSPKDHSAKQAAVFIKTKTDAGSPAKGGNYK